MASRQKRAQRQKESSKTVKYIVKRILGVRSEVLLGSIWLLALLGGFRSEGDPTLIRQAILTIPFFLYGLPLLVYVISDWCVTLVFIMWPQWILNLLFTQERSVDQYVHAYPVLANYVTQNNTDLLFCTGYGIDLWLGFLDVLLNAHSSNKSWRGNFSLEHLRMSNHECRVAMEPTYPGSFSNLLLDLSKLATLLMPHFRDNNQNPEPYVQKFYMSMTNPQVSPQSSDADKAKFLKFMRNHLALRSPRQRRVLINELYQAYKAMGPADKMAFEGAVGKVNVAGWINLPMPDLRMTCVLYYSRRPSNNPRPSYVATSTELLRFLRNYWEHGGDDDGTGQHVIGTMEDLDHVAMSMFAEHVVDMVWELIVDLDMSGLLQYAWEKYVN